MNDSINPFDPSKKEPISTDLPPTPSSGSVFEYTQDTSAQDTSQQTFIQPYMPQNPSQNNLLPVSGLGIAALVCGAIALFGSFIPVANLVFIILALVGLGLGIAGVISVSKGKKRGKGWGIAGIVASALALIIAIFVNVFFWLGVKHVMNDPQFQQSFEEAGQMALDDLESDLTGNEKAQTQNLNLTIGQTATTDDGLKITVTAVEPASDDLLGDYLKVTVAYDNAGQETEDFGPYDWGSIDASGVFETSQFFSVDTELKTGALTPGSKTEGQVAISKDAATITYDADYDDEPEMSWKVK